MENIENALKYLSGGWVSVALTVLLAIIAIFLFVYKDKILRERAARETEEEKEKVTDDEKEKAKEEESHDKENRDKGDDFFKN